MNELETIVGGRIFYVRHPGLDTRSAPGDVVRISTQADVASLLDDAVDASLEERGCRGSASAHLELQFLDGTPADENDDDDDAYTYERIDGLDHPSVLAMPAGTPDMVRKYIRWQRQAGTIWDGKNRRPCSTYHLDSLLARMRNQS